MNYRRDGSNIDVKEEFLSIPEMILRFNPSWVLQGVVKTRERPDKI